MKVKTLVFVVTSLVSVNFAFAEVPTGGDTVSASTCVVGNPQSSPAYQATQWYRDSVERNAIYREVFLMGQMRVKEMVKHQHLHKHKWGVVFDIDETLLDNSALVKDQTIGQCKPRTAIGFSEFAMTEVSTALPGAVNATCGIQKMGGYVTLISNRDGGYIDPKTDKSLLTATEENLKKQGICFNQIILASNGDGNKNPRFDAVRSGTYPKGMAYSAKLPAHPIIAFFGDNVQDFPKLMQAEMIKQNPNGKAYEVFGRHYFVLPNTTYGSFQDNPFQ